MKRQLLPWLIAMVCSRPGFSAILRVPSDYPTIQAALDAAVDGDTVLVAPGEFSITEPLDFNRLHSADPRSPALKNITLKSEGGAEKTSIRMSETPSDSSRASVVLFQSGEKETSVLSGLTLKGGGGTLSPPFGATGGGILCGQNSAPTVTDCTITANKAATGGGISCLYSSPTLLNCKMLGNSAERQGGGFDCFNSSPTVTDCTFSQNQAGLENNFGGGGIDCQVNSSPRLTRCTITKNSSIALGGGLRCQSKSSPTLLNCTIDENLAVVGAGAAFDVECSPSFNSCSITRNRATYEGGGVYINLKSSVTLSNCTISGNIAGLVGGGFYCTEESLLTLIHCTLSGNAALEGSGVLSKGSAPTLKNCIVWDNAGSQLSADRASIPKVTYSCVGGDTAWPGKGNIHADPLFCGWTGKSEEAIGLQADFEASDDDYSLALSPRSPCLGSGEDGANMGADTGTCDFAGSQAKRISLAPGTYALNGISLAHRLSIQGSGEGTTILEGTVYGLGTGATLSDLTVTKGTSSGLVIGEGEAPQILRCTITGNTTIFYGAGIACRGSPTLIGCTLKRNWLRNIGGGMECRKSSPTLRKCTVTENAAMEGGGLAFSDSSSPKLIDCVISRNFASDHGGGIFCYDASATIDDSAILSNMGQSGGGGVYCAAKSSPALTNCTISGNATREFGTPGGVYSFDASPFLLNCLITANTDGAVFGYHSSPVLINCTVSNNLCKQRGAVELFDSSTPTLTNCIIWSNGTGTLQIDETSNVEKVTYSCIDGQTVWPGMGNIKQDPVLAHPGKFDFQSFLPFEIGDLQLTLPDFINAPGDYRLAPESPAIDAGTSLQAVPFDLDGKGRPCGGAVDLGAYESGDCPPPIPFRRGDVNASGKENITDAILILSFLFTGEPATLECEKSADVDDSGKLDLTDPINLLGYLFKGGPPPSAPFSSCGIDRTIDGLGCKLYPSCTQAP